MQAQSLLQNSTPLNFLPKKHQIFLPIILLLNSIKITFPSFYYFSIIFQHIPLLIISIDFQINNTSSQKKFSKIIRYFSSYKLQEIISNANFYLIVNIIFILVELFYFLYFLKKHLELSKHNKSSFLKPKPKVHLLITILYYFNMLFISQLTEFLSLIIYHIIFKDKFILLLPKNLSTLQYILLCCNILFIFMLNLNYVLHYLAMNFPFHSSNDDITTLKTQLTKKKIVCEIILNNLGMIHFIDFFVSDSTLKIIKIVIYCMICVFLITIIIIELIHLNFEEYINYTSCFIYSFSLISIITEIIIRGCNSQITQTKTVMFFFLCKLCMSFCLVNYLSSLKVKIFISKLNKILFRIYEDRLNDYQEFYDCIYFLFSFMYLKDHSKISFVSNFLLDHEKKCKNDMCKCKLIDLVPLNNLSLNNIEFCKQLINRIGFYIETCIIKIDYTSDYYLTVLLAEYYYLIKLNPIMSFSIIDTYFNSIYNKKVNLLQNVNLCLLINRYALKCSKKIHYDNMCELYQSLLFDKIITKIMKEYVKVFEKEINNKESFENGIKLIYYIDSTDIKNIQSKFLTPSNIEMITDILIKKDTLYYLLIKLISSYINYLSDSIPVEFYLKCILFYNLFNTGKIPSKILLKQNDHFGSINYSHKSNTLRTYQNSINFFCEETICDDIENILNKHYSKQTTSYNIIIKCVKGFKIQYISGELGSKIGYHKYKKSIDLIGEDLEILLPQSISTLHHQAMIKYIIANKNFSFVGKKYLFTQEMQMMPCTLTVCSMPGIFEKHLGILCNVLLNQTKNKHDLVILQNNLNETIALSNSFYVKYDFTLDLIEKYGINLLELFELNVYEIQKTFSKDIKKIQKLKRLINISTEHTFCSRLFQNKLQDNEMNMLNKSGLFENIGKTQKVKVEDLLLIRNEIEMMYSYYKLTSNKGNTFLLFKDKKMEFKKKKVKILSNIFKVLLKYSELELFNEYSKQLQQAISKVKKQLNVFGYNCNFTSTQSFGSQSFNNFPKKVETTIFNTNLINKNSQNFDIKIILKCLYGTPLFVIKIKDKDKFGIRISNMKIGIESEQNIDINKDNQKKLSNKYYSSSSKLINSSNQFNLKKKGKHFNKDSTSLSLLYFLSSTSNDQEFKKELNLLVGLFSALFLSILITSILFYLEDKILRNSHLLFHCLFINSYQKDNILNIYDSILSILFQIKTITNCTEHNLSIDDYFEKLNSIITTYENNYHEFYSLYQVLKDRDLNFNTYYSFTKIQINWNETVYQDDYLGEVYTLIYYCKEVIRERHKLADIENDIDMVIYDQYKEKVNNSIKTNYGKTLFYILKNYYQVYRKIFNDFETQIIEAFGEYFKLAVLRLVSVEVLGLIGFVVFYLLILIFLNWTNTGLFETIMKMFLEGSDLNIERIAAKNHGENVFLKNKLNDTLELLNNFQFSNLRKFKNLKYDPKKASTLYYEKLSKLNPQNTFGQNKSISNGQLFQQSTHNDSVNFPKPSVNSILKIPKGSTITNSSKINVFGEGINSINTMKFPHNSSIIKPHTRKKAQTNTNLHLLNASISNTTSHLATTKMNLINTTNSNIQHLASSVDNDVSLNDPNQHLNLQQIIAMTYNEGFPLIKILSFLIILFFLFILVLIILKIYFSLSYLTDNKHIFEEFIVLTSKYSNLYYYFNSLRKLLISPPSETMINYFKEVTGEVNTNWANSKNIDIKKFPKIYKLSMQVNSQNIDEKNVTFDFFDNGLTTVSEAIMHYIASVFSDYVSEVNPINSTDKVKTLLINNKNDYSMTLIETSFNFVYEDLQTKIYQAFNEDSSNIKNTFQSKIDIFNTCCIIYCIPIIFFVIYGVVLSVNTKVRIAKRSSKKFIKTIKHLLTDYKKKKILDSGTHEIAGKEQSIIGYNVPSIVDSSLFIKK